MEATTVVAVSVVVTLFFDIPMQEIKNVVMESTDSLVTEVPAKDPSTAPNEEKKSVKLAAEEKKVFEEDEVSSTGWDWQRDIVDGGVKYSAEALEDEERVDMPILKKPGGRRRSFIGQDSSGPEEGIPAWEWIKESNKRLSREEEEKEEEYRRRGRRSRSSQRDYQEEGRDALDLSRMQQEREEAIKRGRRSLSRSLDAKRLSTRESEGDEEGEEEEEEEEDPRRYRGRSESRGRSVIRESDDYRSWELVGKERSSSAGPDSKRLFSKSEEREPAQRQTRAHPPPHGRRTFSSESEDELSSQRRKIEKRHPPVEPRISDEEDWEGELRIRRKQFMEKLATQQRTADYYDEEDFASLRRRSSAEGKIALLKDPTANDNMDSWTISVGSRVAQLGSSQERSEPEEDVYMRRREYRESAPLPREDIQSEEDTWDESRRKSYTSSSQITSVEEDEDVAEFNFVLTKDSKRISVQDLSKLSPDDPDLADSGWNVVKDENEGAPKTGSMGLFKRESIVKSQASEEDPEYLLPERPKLVQQEREHPFKKAWQMQKSRSEEDGSAYIIKESKEAKLKVEDTPEPRKEHSGEQYEDIGSFADDESESVSLARSRSTDTEENTRTSSKSEETESTERSDSTSIEANKANSRSSDVEEDTLRFNWPSEEERLDVYKTVARSKSEEVEWSWEREQT